MAVLLHEYNLYPSEIAIPQVEPKAENHQLPERDCKLPGIVLAES